MRGLESLAVAPNHPQLSRYDELIAHLWHQVGVLLAIGIILFLFARRFAKRWESV